MNKILIFSIILLGFFTRINAQTGPSVSINCSSANCFTPEPGLAVTYEVTATSGYTVQSYNWTSQGDLSHGGNGTQFFTVTWPNTPSSSAKSISVSVVLTKDNYSYTRSDNKTITVKYISPISSISISGGGVSGAYTNNGTVPVPCGSRTFTLTAAPPTTNPTSNVVYEWLLPSGWSGSSSTNSITVTAPAGSTDQPVTLRYRRSDSNSFLQFFGLLMDRPQVGTPNIGITSGNLGCVGSSATLSATATGATSFTWSSTSGVGISPTSGSSTTATVNGNGAGAITVTANNACQAPQSSNFNFAGGTPTIYAQTQEGALFTLTVILL